MLLLLLLLLLLFSLIKLLALRMYSVRIRSNPDDRLHVGFIIWSQMAAEQTWLTSAFVAHGPVTQ